MQRSRLSCSSRLKRREQGFTLVELLIAMALLVIICGAVYGTYFSLMNGREAAVSGMEGRRELRSTLDMIRREINAVMYTSKNTTGKKFYFVVEDRDFFGKPASVIRYTTIAPPNAGTAPVSDILEVAYEPVEKNNKILLTRKAKDFHFDMDVKGYPQMEDIEGFLVECYDGTKWVKSWDMTLRPDLPKAVKVTLQLKEGGKPVQYGTTATPRITAQ